MAEAWLPVCGFEGFYEVSNLGRVRSVDRTVTRDYGDKRKTTVRRRGAIMKFDYRDGYPRSGLRHGLNDLHSLRWKLAPDVVTLLLPRVLEIPHKDAAVRLIQVLPLYANDLFLSPR
ncbi:NUMOD4 domain-containing protein [Agrobacterium sp.]|uniref:NUMOD4 domain-containing protein n=1 Tax=Agrobacterium sp. TaxID=361 RepID=UPI00391862FC